MFSSFITFYTIIVIDIGVSFDLKEPLLNQLRVLCLDMLAM